MDTSLNFLKKNLQELYKNKFFLFTAITTLFQYIFFILLISDGNASAINFKTAFACVPPLLVYLCFVFIPYSFVFLFSGAKQRIFIIIINLLITLLLIFDLWYYRSNSSFLNYYMLSMATNLDGLASSILAMFRPVDLLFLVSTVILIIMYIKDRDYCSKYKKDFNKFYLLFLIPILYLSYNHIKVDKFQKGYPYQHLFKRMWSQNKMMYNLTPLGYHAYDFYNYIKDKQNYILSQEEKTKIKAYFNSKENTASDSGYAGKFKGKNLIILQVESLENFVINESIDNQEITPNLNKLIDNSLYFSNYHEQTLNGTTSDATFVSNTSMLPVLVGNNNFNYPFNDYNSLPKLLKQMSYNTYSLHGEKGTYWNWIMAEKHMGFDTCSDLSAFKIDEILGLGLSDKSFLSQAVKKIEKQKKPFFTFMITLTSHTPFNFVKDQTAIKLPENLQDTKTGGFIESVHYADEAIGNLINELDKSGILEDTLVVIYGDHEGLNKYFHDEVLEIEGIPDKWKNNDKKVPLIVYSKGLMGEEIKTNGGQVDFLPTISSLMGVDESKYRDTALGRNLLNTNKNYVVLTNKTYRGTEISDEEKEKYVNILETSNIMIKSNYFKGR
jgi:lipoteichoic acid synthase